MTTMHVGILMGGLSAEREVSLQTGHAVHAALLERGYTCSLICSEGNLDAQLRSHSIDVAFVALHGTFGEDGCVQGLLELRGIPYTGSDVLGSALSMDKLKAKELFRLHNLPTPPYYMLAGEELPRLQELHGCFGYPAFVKPRRQGSSLGAGRARNFSELQSRCEHALNYDDDVLVERFMEGREIAVGVLDGRALGAIEIEPKGEFYDYDSKYTLGRSSYHLPARLPPTRYQGVLNLAERAAQALGARGVCRVDLLVSEGKNEQVLEVNTLPGLTPLSLLPQIAQAAGYDFGALCEAILERAVQPRAGRLAPAAAETRTAQPNAGWAAAE